MNDATPNSAMALLHLLIVEDVPSDAELMVLRLKEEGLNFDWQVVQNEPDYLAALDNKPNLILADWHLPQFGGLRALQLLKERGLEIPFIIVSGSIGEEAAVDAMHHGASDYVAKDRLSRLEPAVNRAMEYSRLREERLQAEETLRENEARYRTIADNGRALIWTADVNKLCDYFNQPWLDFTGRSMAQELGNGWAEGVHPDDFEQCLAEYVVAFERREKFSIVYRLRRYDGEYRWLLDDGAPRFDRAGNFIGYIGHCLDITEQKQAEAQIKAQLDEVAKINANLEDINDQLEHAKNQLLQSEKMAVIGQLAAGVAHEINNPVGYVYSNLGTLGRYLADIFAMMDKYEEAEALMDCHGSAIDKIHQFKAQIDLNFLKEDIKLLIDESCEGLNRVKKIVLDLKDFSHADDNEEWKWASLQQGLESTMNIVWNELKYKCEVEKEFVDLPQIYCLPSQLNQVFMNLLVNAAQSIDERGTLILRTGLQGERVWVEVADTGKGIKPENLKRIFDPFFTTKPVGEGTGLGLSLSYNIVAKHHGSIEVQSEVGKGTTFRIWLPVTQPDIVEPA
ncbi:MAG: PAS domain S-box protein [Betaproteobacteria bacterium]|nr:PAS domain S-box protein [Betaproteobacteria bacterium]